MVTNRSLQDVYYRKALSAKGWNGMTVAERAEWLGDPLATAGANLFSCGPYYSSAVELKYRREEIFAKTNAAGTYLYAISIIGDAANYANKVFTLSAESMVSSTTGTPQLAVYWHDDNGYEYAGASLVSAGSVTFNTTEWPNTNGRKYLAVYVYVTTHELVPSGATATFGKVMLVNDSIKHPYQQYYEILPTRATRGAYNYSDLNRVERAVSEIGDRLNVVFPTKTNWSAWDIPRHSDMARFLLNLGAIHSRLPQMEGLPSVPATMNNLTYTEANNIELILETAYKYI